MTYTESLERNEFLFKLSNEHKVIFLKALAHLARIDGHVDDEEIKYIKDAARYYKIEQTDDLFTPADEKSILQELKKLNDRRIALELIKELCLLGHADSNLSADETLFIGHAGLAMGVELDKIEQISNWIIDKIIWLEQGKIIFEDA